ncbi:MAG: M6 family metalloprotease domain-containing protein [Prevotella sp.]|nr:M6 family metalloprotease domain-containing protein [Prevotella sp.]MCM1074554.1 M6 family metalloprotease domain-containing protein [Ruminococcus sp.]
MKIKNRLLISSIMLAGSLSLFAVPAKREVQTVTQPDGSTLRIKKIGDEFRHFTLTEDDIILADAPDGGYCYGRLNNAGFVESTGVLAVDLSKRSFMPVEAMNFKEVDLKAVPLSPKKIPQTGVGLDKTTFPGKGSPNVLVILVEYKDYRFRTSDPLKYFDGMLNEEGFSQYGGTGSCSEYFKENSMGQFTPNFVCLGPVQLPNKRSYYGGNDYGGSDRAPEEMVIDAIKILDPDYDFSIFDNDGDGEIDNVYVIYAGQGEASYGDASTVWPHSWSLAEAGKSLMVDGVAVNHYGCSNEWEQTRPDGIGTFVHEFSHVMGLPDLYNTVSNTVNYTPESYSVLDYGPYNNNGCTPPAYGAYERNSLGWIDLEVIDEPMDGELEHILSSNKAYIIPTESKNEFFLLENRQQEGWDKYIPGHGMLVWHIDFNASVWANNVVNNNEYHQYVDLEEACGYNGTTEAVFAAYPFPGTKNVTSFTDDTTPSMKAWNGQGLNMPITDIAETDGVITFKAAGGDDGLPKVKVPKPFADDQVEKSSSHFVAAWEPVENAIDYEVTAYATGAGEGYTLTNAMGADGVITLPEGWSATTSEKYTSNGNYGESAPSLKFNADAQYLLSPELEGEAISISYWRKGQSTNGKSSLDVMGLVGNSWVKLYSESLPTRDEAKVVEINNLPENVSQVKFIYNKQGGNLALDDVTIKVGASDEVLPDYNAVKTNGATSLRIDKLKEGITTYKYHVRAIGEFKQSAYSDKVSVKLSDTDSLTDVEMQDAPVEYFDTLGRRVINPAPGQILICRQGNRVFKTIAR